MAPGVDRWYAFVPWIVCLGLVGWRHGVRRAVLLGALGWAVAFGAEWGSTAGPGIPFGPYLYRSGALAHDWRLAGVPIFDSLSFTWLAVSSWTLAGWLAARGWWRGVAAVVMVVAVDVGVDPVALRGAHWWLGRIYLYPAPGPWFGVTVTNYLGWIVVAAVLVGLCSLLLRAPTGRPAARRGPFPLRLVSAALLLGVEAESSVLAVRLGVAPAALASWGVAAVGVALAVGMGHRRARRAAGVPGSGAPGTPGPGVVVACALAWEARLVRRALPGWGAVPPPPGVRRAWRRGRDQLWLTGAGPFDLPPASGPTGARAIVVTGVAGAVGPGWSAGDVAVGTAWVDAAGRRGRLEPELGASPWGESGSRRAATVRAAVLGAAAVAVDGKRARSVWAERGAELVDMETGSWARWRDRRVAAGLPAPALVVLRAVLDTPARPLGRAAQLVGAGATGPRAAGVLGWVLGDHRAALALWRLAADRRRAAGALGPALAQLVDGRSERPRGARPAPVDPAPQPAGRRR